MSQHVWMGMYLFLLLYYSLPYSSYELAQVLIQGKLHAIVSLVLRRARSIFDSP